MFMLGPPQETTRNFMTVQYIPKLGHSVAFSDLFESDLLVLFPEFFLCIATVLLLVYGVVIQDDSKDSTIQTTYSRVTHMAHLGWLAAGTCLLAVFLVVNNPVQHAVILYNSLITDELTGSFKIAILLTTSCCFAISQQYWRQQSSAAFECVILILCASLSMLILTSSYDLITLYMAIELQSLSFYALAASNKTSEFSTEAGLKYFLLGALSSGILLLGCSLIYGFTGITNFQEFSRLLVGFPEHAYNLARLSETGFFLGVLCVAVGFLFKLTAAPFHMWAPDVYEGSPTAITALFSIVPKIALLGVCFRLFHVSFYDIMPTWQTLFLIASALSMLLGSLAAIYQTRIKRLLAYSSISHMGYMLLGFSCGTVQGIQAVIFYLIIYIIMSVNMFSLLLGLQQAGPASATRMNRIKYITDLRTLGITHPVLAVTLTVTLFSLAGIPPLAGFCAKFYVFFTALSTRFYALALLGILTSTISCFYYIRIIRAMYFDTQNAHMVWPVWQSISRENAWLLANTSLLIVLFFANPSIMLLTSHEMALAVCV